MDFLGRSFLLFFFFSAREPKKKNFGSRHTRSTFLLFFPAFLVRGCCFLLSTVKKNSFLAHDRVHREHYDDTRGFVFSFSLPVTTTEEKRRG